MDRKEVARWLAHVATPTPLVSWLELTLMVDPLHEPTRSRYRTIKSSGRATDGVRVYPRSASRLRGSESIHSVLSALALQAERDGAESEAQVLVRAAQKLEERFEKKIQIFLSHSSLEDLPSAEFYAELVGATSRALAKTSWDTHLFAAACVREFDGEWGSVVAIAADGAHSEVDMRRELLDSWSLDIGDIFFVFQRTVHSASVLEVLPAAKSVGAFDFESAMWPRRDDAERRRILDLLAAGKVGKQNTRLTA